MAKTALIFCFLVAFTAHFQESSCHLDEWLQRLQLGLQRFPVLFDQIIKEMFENKVLPPAPGTATESSVKKEPEATFDAGSPLVQVPKESSVKKEPVTTLAAGAPLAPMITNLIVNGTPPEDVNELAAVVALKRLSQTFILNVNDSEALLNAAVGIIVQSADQAQIDVRRKIRQALLPITTKFIEMVKRAVNKTDYEESKCQPIIDQYNNIPHKYTNTVIQSLREKINITRQHVNMTMTNIKAMSNSSVTFGRSMINCNILTLNKSECYKKLNLDIQKAIPEISEKIKGRFSEALQYLASINRNIVNGDDILLAEAKRDGAVAFTEFFICANI